jgi:Ca2+:H+ antiporter
VPEAQEAPGESEGTGLLTVQNVLLVVFVPLALSLHKNGAPPVVTFIAAGICFIPLSGLIEKATEALAERFGPTVGALLNSSLGNLPELIISITALQKGLDNVVKGAIIGAVIGNLLLSLGAGIFLGGFRKANPKFDALSAGVSGNLLFLGVAAILLPLLFNLSGQANEREISREIAVVLLVAYLMSLIFSLFTHKQYLGTAKEGHEEAVTSAREWGVVKALIVLAATAAVLALVSDALTEALTPMAQKLGLSDVFAGMFLLAAAGNIPESLNVISFARRGNMELAFNVVLQSCTQMVVFVAPLLVFISYFMGGSMDLSFAPFAAGSMVLAVLAVRGLVIDGETNWMEGVFLIALYVLLGIGVFYLPVK